MLIICTINAKNIFKHIMSLFNKDICKNKLLNKEINSWYQNLYSNYYPDTVIKNSKFYRNLTIIRA